MSEPTWELLGGGGVVGGPIDYIGDWAAGTQYQPGQVVRYSGVDYLAVNPSLGQTPPAAFGIGAGYGTSLPASPVNGQEYTLVDSTTNPTYQWRFRYNAGSSSAYKWEFVGGAPAFSGFSGDENLPTVDTTWRNFPTSQAVTIPRAGEYLLEGSCRFWSNAALATWNLGFGNAYIGEGGDDQKVQSSGFSMYRSVRPGALTAATVVSLQFKASTLTSGFGSYRMLRVTPVRVS